MIPWAVLALLAAASSGEIPLPARVSVVKWQQGRVAALAGAPGGPELLVWDPGWKEPRRLPLQKAVGQARMIEVADFALDTSGTLYAAVYADLTLGRFGRRLCRFPEHGEARCAEAGPLRCRALAVAGPDELWCFSTGPGGLALERIGDPRQGVRYWLPAETGGPEPPGSTASSWLAAPMPGLAWLYVGQRMRLYRADLRSGQIQTVPIPAAPGRHSLPSFAAWGGRLLGLFSLQSGGAAERLDAPYGLFELADGRWVPVAPGRNWMRGAVLAGMEERAAWVWNRAARRLERVELPDGQGAGPEPR